MVPRAQLDVHRAACKQRPPDAEVCAPEVRVKREAVVEPPTAGTLPCLGERDDIAKGDGQVPQ